MTDHARAIEAGARAAARVQGDNFDKIPRDKPHWTAERGLFNDRFRDINEPFQSCYLEMSEEVIKAAIASGALVPASAVAEMRDGSIDRVAEAIAARAIERGHPIKPVVVRHVAVAAIEAIRQLDTAPASGEYVVVPPLTRTQFIVQMILCYSNLYPQTETRELMKMAADTYRDFIADEKIEFGDPRYDWSKSGAQEIVCGYENAMLNAASSNGGGK